MASIKAEKIWADAIRRAVNRYLEVEGQDGAVRKAKYINHLADTLCKNAAKGNVKAMREIGDRLDGRPSQALEINTRITLVDFLRETSSHEAGLEIDPPVEGQPLALCDRSSEGHA